MTFGSLLRRYRKEKKLTLKTVAEKSGVSEGFMSQVENNVKSPSLDTLMHICEAMDVNVGDLLNQFKNQERIVVISRNEWEDVDLPHTGFATRRFWPPEYRTVIDSAILFLEPKRSSPVRKDIKNSQEVLCILKGAVELIHGDRTVYLEEGDTVHLWSDPLRQSITNTSHELAVVLWVATI